MLVKAQAYSCIRHRSICKRFSTFLPHSHSNIKHIRRDVTYGFLTDQTYSVLMHSRERGGTEGGDNGKKREKQKKKKQKEGMRNKRNREKENEKEKVKEKEKMREKMRKKKK